MPESKKRKIVILNQAANYLTIGFANAFNQKFDEVVLIAGSVHVQGEELEKDVYWHKINLWHEAPTSKKILSFLKALFNMWWLLMTKYRHHEVLFVSVPPMGYLLNLVLPHRFSMVIWDVYPDIFKITGMKETHPVYKIWSYLNKKSFKKAYRLFTISEKMADLLAKYVEKNKVIIQPIWSIFQDNQKIDKRDNTFIKQHQLEDKFIVQYSGNIGLTHNVEILIDVAEQLQDNLNILFQIIGRGPRKKHLERLVQEKNLPNCMFLPFQSDEMFPYSLSAADLGVVILDEKTSKGSVPSKSYNLMSYGIPSLYIASKDSQLAVYADRYRHAHLFTKQEISKVAAWIEGISQDQQKQNELSKNALQAAQDFKRNNADNFVDKYLSKNTGDKLYFKSKFLSFDNLNEEEYEIKIWRPSISKPLPPGKPFKYIILSFLYALGLFRSKNYFLIELFNKDEELMSSALIVPKFWKFKYMGKNDVQFIYVMVNEKFRGKNLAIHTIKESLAYLKEPVNKYWYVTNKSNVASVKTAKKVGFEIENI